MMTQNKLVPKRRFEGFKEKWSQFFISEFCDIKTGGTPSTKVLDYWYPAEIPWMSSGEVNKKRLFNTDIKISKIGLNNSSARWIKKDSILIGLAGQGKTRGTVAINKIPLTSNQSIAAIELKNGFNSEFLFQNLGNRYEELRTMSSGDGSRGGLNKKIISEIRVFLPNDVEQQKIGQFFKHLDDMIALQQRKIDKTKALKSAYLAEMFPAEGEHVPKRRFEGFKKTWKKIKLERLFQQSGSGGTPRTTRKDYYGGNIPFLGISDITNSDGYIYQTEKKITKEGLNNSAAWIVPKESISLAMYASVGKVAILKVESATSQAFYNMVIEDHATRDFVYQYLVKMEAENMWNKIISTGTQANLNAEKVRNLNILIPTDIKERKSIGNLFKNIDNLIATHQQKLEKLKATKQAYLHEMFV